MLSILISIKVFFFFFCKEIKGGITLFQMTNIQPVLKNLQIKYKFGSENDFCLYPFTTQSKLLMIARKNALKTFLEEEKMLVHV